MVKAMAGCPAKMGFRMPAEWEPHDQCWMGWPVRTPPSFYPSLICLSGCSAATENFHHRNVILVTSNGSVNFLARPSCDAAVGFRSNSIRSA
jgi:hypothetical protein